MREEQTYSRDLSFSIRHRQYGSFVPAVDLDFILIEHDFGKPTALIEYKKFNAWNVDLNHSNYKAISYLATNSNIPAFVVWYYPDTWSYFILPLNEIAKDLVVNKKVPQKMHERNFCRFLWWLRDKSKINDIPAKILDGLKKESWPENIEPRFTL